MCISKNNKSPLFGKKAEQEIESREKDELAQNLENLMEEHQNIHDYKLTGFVCFTDFANISRHDNLPVFQPDCLLTEFSNGGVIMRNK